MSFFIYLFLFVLISCSYKDINENIINNSESKRNLENDDYEEINILFDIRDITSAEDSIKRLHRQYVDEVNNFINFVKTFNNTLKKLIKIKKKIIKTSK